MTKAAKAASTTMTGRTVRTGSPIWSRRSASRSAAKTISAILASSEGWNCMKPVPNQRREPLTVIASGFPGIATNSNSPNEAPRIGTASVRRRW